MPHALRRSRSLTPQSLFTLLLILLSVPVSSTPVNEPPLASNKSTVSATRSGASTGLPPANPGGALDPTTLVRDRRKELLCAFAFVRGSPRADLYATFEHGHQCLRDAMPSGIQYDHVLFHEGDIAPDVQMKLSSAL